MSLPLTAENLAKNDAPRDRRRGLFDLGNIVLDIPHPAYLPADHDTNPVERTEYNYARFSAVNCKATEFLGEEYVFRPSLFARPRKTKLLISVAISDAHDETTIRKTLDSIFNNINQVLTTPDLSSKIEWRNIVVLIVGSTQGMQAGTQAHLCRLDVFPDFSVQLDPSLLGWAGQIYECTTTFRRRLRSDPQIDTQFPCQLIFFNSMVRLAIDESNVWVVRAFAPVLKARKWISVEPGKELKDNAFVSILREFKKDPSCATVDSQPSKMTSSQQTSPALPSDKDNDTGNGQPVEKILTDIGDAASVYRLGLF